jgi:putative ABC transport system permease protein
MTVQVAISVLLVLGTTLLVRSVTAHLQINPGFEVSRLYTFMLDPRPSLTKPMHVLHREITDRVSAISGVRRASIAFLPPFYTGTEARLFYKPAGAEQQMMALNSVGVGFFDTIGLPFVSGRDFTQLEVDSAEPQEKSPVIVTESAARRIFGGTDVVGRSFVGRPGSSRTVVGVVRESRHRRLTSEDSSDIAFQPYTRSYTTPFVTVLVAVSEPNPHVWSEIRRVLHEVEPTMVMFEPRTAGDGIRAELGEKIMATRLVGAFAALAILTAAAGFYSVLARMLIERTPEFGTRLAVGASHAHLVRLISQEAGLVVTLGVLFGVLAGFNLTQFLQHSLFGVSPRDLPSFVTAATVLVVVTIVSAAPVCIRAARLDIASTLRRTTS